ncbi:hypothetical protein [Brevibacillus dissolubilis]|uniref:hypothetical protein n=1 Tax=Brevibacillus dissolubilis TaxID=1844116 RepID=UPI00159BDADD|nr:hypothetical protein [Brevibacillus dissolubilis]
MFCPRVVKLSKQKVAGFHHTKGKPAFLWFDQLLLFTILANQVLIMMKHNR